ncbi:MAG TPA: 16S rRNA (guanine(966)-N(2))-methyltransferase RsmD [Bryobacteraceae bacterium]|jgi:16S rRNA (guanine(966)-N(2))-methyltransferase RsmD|nr:16S rRNA (guanine(966)-N(2))-methyltransferase RsmD [Bryobacteraceae bacterium]
MRVIAGRFRSRRIKSLPGLAVRPTPDRLRESLFSILAPRLEGATFLDAYAGSGSVGIEALSRGAAHVTFIEQNSAALAILRENLASLGIRDEARVLRGRAGTFLAKEDAEIVFLDPPYDAADEYAASLEALAQSNCSLVVAQHASRLSLAESYGALKRTRVLKQGDNSLSFFERA